MRKNLDFDYLQRQRRNERRVARNCQCLLEFERQKARDRQICAALNISLDGDKWYSDNAFLRRIGVLP